VFVFILSAPDTYHATPAPTPIPSSYPSNLLIEETCCDNGNVAVKPKPKLKSKPKPKPKSKKSSKSISIFFNNTKENLWPALTQESNFTPRPTGTPKPKLASQLTNYNDGSSSWVSKNHYSLGTECWWEWKTPAILVVIALATLLGLVTAARSVGRMVRSKSIRSYHFILRFIVLVHSSPFTTLLITK